MQTSVEFPCNSQLNSRTMQSMSANNKQRFVVLSQDSMATPFFHKWSGKYAEMTWFANATFPNLVGAPVDPAVRQERLGHGLYF